VLEPDIRAKAPHMFSFTATRSINALQTISNQSLLGQYESCRVTLILTGATRYVVGATATSLERHGVDSRTLGIRIDGPSV